MSWSSRMRALEGARSTNGFHRAEKYEVHVTMYQPTLFLINKNRPPNQFSLKGACRAEIGVSD